MANSNIVVNIDYNEWLRLKQAEEKTQKVRESQQKWTAKNPDYKRNYMKEWHAKRKAEALASLPAPVLQQEVDELTKKLQLMKLILSQQQTTASL